MPMGSGELTELCSLFQRRPWAVFELWGQETPEGFIFLHAVEGGSSTPDYKIVQLGFQMPGT